MLGQYRALFSNRSFRWHIAGSTVNVIGDQFTLLAMPWLVLTMTGDPLIMSNVLLAGATPRFLFLLIGGAVVDRHSPKRTLLATRFSNALLLGAFGALVFTGRIELWMVYCFALASGTIAAFNFPAARSMLRDVVAPEHLPTANSLIDSVYLSATMAAPALAGLIIAHFGDAATGRSAHPHGLGIAFLVDAATFAISTLTLSRVVVRANAPAAAGSQQPNMLHSILEGIRYSWGDRDLRFVILSSALVNFCCTGPVMVGIPVLSLSLSSSAVAFGLLTSANGVGSLFGAILAGTRPPWTLKDIRTTRLTGYFLIGVFFLPLAFVRELWQAALCMALIGTGRGFLQIASSSWVQRSVNKAVIGRVMSLIFLLFALAPVSGVVVGWLLHKVGVHQVFGGIAILLLIFAAGARLANGLGVPMRAAPAPATAAPTASASAVDDTRDGRSG